MDNFSLLSMLCRGSDTNHCACTSYDHRWHKYSDRKTDKMQLYMYRDYTNNINTSVIFKFVFMLWNMSKFEKFSLLNSLFNWNYSRVILTLINIDKVARGSATTINCCFAFHWNVNSTNSSSSILPGVVSVIWLFLLIIIPT